jgi:hypothetical protein
MAAKFRFLGQQDFLLLPALTGDDDAILVAITRA